MMLPHSPAHSLGLRRLVSWACAALCGLLVCWTGSAEAQLSTYRLEIRKAQVQNDQFTLYVTLLNSTQDAIPKVDLAKFALLSDEKQEPIAWSNPQIQLLKDSKKNVAVMFVIANTRAFNESTTRGRAATVEFLDKMRDIDIAGVVTYGEQYRVIPFTQNTKLLAEQLGEIKDGDEAQPRFLGALGEALRRFNKDLDQQSIDQRYMVIISDGADPVTGIKDESATQSKIDQFAKRFQELQITPIVIGHSPLLGEADEGLPLLRQLAARSNGTYREVPDKDREGLFTAVAETSYNEVYSSLVLTFENKTLLPGQSHKVRLSATVESQKLKSPPATVFVPEPEGFGGINKTWLLIGGGVCLGLGLLVGLGFVIFLATRKKPQEEVVEDPYAGVQPQAGPGGAPMPMGGVMAPPEEVVNDEPPPSYFAKLSVRSGPMHGRKFYLTLESTTMGKDPSNNIILRDNTVSKRHAGIRIKDAKRYELHDFGSSNGSFINGHRVSKQFLKDGDVIKLGETEIIFTLQ